GVDLDRAGIVDGGAVDEGRARQGFDQTGVADDQAVGARKLRAARQVDRAVVVEREGFRDAGGGVEAEPAVARDLPGAVIGEGAVGDIYRAVDRVVIVAGE